ncbi:MAG: hypothetical protein GX967_02410 [Clostridiales bacterium]|nr:hypothetical protein [Clostridiales bacterium]
MRRKRSRNIPLLTLVIGCVLLLLLFFPFKIMLLISGTFFIAIGIWMMGNCRR